MASPGPRPPERPPVMVLLDRATRSLQDRFVEELAAAGYPNTLAASRLMGHLTEDGLRLSELADRLGITKQSVGQLVDTLQADGYVERIPDPSDGRAKLVVFGPRGYESLPVAWRALQASDDHIRVVLGDAGASRLRAALERLLAADAEG